MKGYSRSKSDFRERLIRKYHQEWIENAVYTVTKNKMWHVHFNKWDKVWMLTILWEIEKRKCGIYEKCQCDCWNIKYVLRYHLSNGKIKSCWCLAKRLSRERLIRASTKHWMYWTHIYNIYIHARERCNNTRWANYHNYWWRWIRFLWDSFEDFYNDMWESYNTHVAEYGRKDTTLDRIDVDGDYCKENCKRSTVEEQNNNRRTNTRVVYMGKEYSSINKLAEAFWIKSYILHHRLKYWRTLKEAIETPVEKRNFRNNNSN